MATGTRERTASICMRGSWCRLDSGIGSSGMCRDALRSRSKRFAAAGPAASARALRRRLIPLRAHFETNVFGLIAVTKALLPLLGTDAKAQGHTGRIINISSIGGVLALPFLSAYAASKHAVEGYSHSLRRELRLVGIKVIILGPGAVKSEIWNKHPADGSLFKGNAYETAFARFRAMLQRAERDAATPESIGEFIRTIHEARRPKPRYVFTPGRLLNWTLPSMLPHAWVDGVLSRMIGLNKPRLSLVPQKL
jgi:NAD(P)-dependent dehydrogenase (short-subunit alcohol dehydrogenase family)